MVNKTPTAWERLLAEALEQRKREREAQLTEVPEDDLSPQELAAEQAKFLERIRTYHSDRVQPSADQPLHSWRDAGYYWLRVTQAGIQRLAEQFNPEPKWALGFRKGPTTLPRAEKDIPESVELDAALLWVPVALRAEDPNQWLITLKCRDTPPEQAPAVMLAINGVPVSPEEVDYRAEAGLLHLVFASTWPLAEAVCEVGAPENSTDALKVRLALSDPS